MKLPKFLIADNTNFPENVYVLHTEYPRFILDIDAEEVEWFDDIEKESEKEELNNLVEEAFAFYDKEIDVYEQEEEGN